MASNICVAELQGYPIQVSGLDGLTQEALTALESPNDIRLQFAPSNTSRTFDADKGLYSLDGYNTFFMGGTQYNLLAVRLCKPKQEGLCSVSGTPLAELQFWGAPTATAVANTALAVFILPIVQRPVESPQGEAFFRLVTGEAVNFVELIPGGRVVRYVTCLETRTTTLNLNVAYWSAGIQITQQIATRFPSPLKTNGVPKFGDMELLSSFTQLADGKKVDRQYTTTDGVLIPYMKTLSATSPAFTTGFRLIKTFEQQVSSPTETDAYKCIAINRSRDIQGGKLVVDPRTGQRLSDEIEQADANDSLTAPQSASIGANEIVQYVFIALGVFLGIALIAGLLVLMLKVLAKPTAVPTASALASGLVSSS